MSRYMTDKVEELTSLLLKEQRRFGTMKRAVVAHLVAYGPCDDIESEDDLFCSNPDCTYCNLARAGEETECAG